MDEAGPSAESPVSEGDDLPELEIVPVPESDLPVMKNEPEKEKESEQETDHSPDSRSAENAEPDGEDVPRRSERHGVPPERLQYTRPGGPLISIVQSLFQGLSLAFTDALHETRDTEPYLGPFSSSKVVSKQPHPCTRMCMNFRGEGVTQR